MGYTVLELIQDRTWANKEMVRKCGYSCRGRGKGYMAKFLISTIVKNAIWKKGSLKNGVEIDWKK